MIFKTGISLKPVSLLLFLLLTITIVQLSLPDSSFSAEDSNNAPEKFKLVQIFPPKEDLSNAPTALSEAIAGIKKAVKNKNVGELMKYIADDIKIGFGVESGKKDFMKMWELDKNPEKSKIWRELETIFNLGGGYNVNQRSYDAPYTFNSKTGELNSFNYNIVTGKGVNVRKAPSSRSEVVKSIDYEVVYVIYNEKDAEEEINGESYPWKQVILSGGEKGYIYGKYMRSPVDFRLSVENSKDGWKIGFLVSGD